MTYRYASGRSVYILCSGIRTWVSTYPPKPAAYGSSDRMPLHTRMLRDKPTDCTVIPGGPGMLLPPMSKNMSFIGVKIGKVADGAFPSWKCWYRFFYMGKEVFNDGISTFC